jgi:hypothetical protein
MQVGCGERSAGLETRDTPPQSGRAPDSLPAQQELPQFYCGDDEETGALLSVSGQLFGEALFGIAPAV